MQALKALKIRLTILAAISAAALPLVDTNLDLAIGAFRGWSDRTKKDGVVPVEW